MTFCNPTVNAQETLPGLGSFAQVLPGTSGNTNWNPWTAGNATINGGHGQMPLAAALDWRIYNLGSNTANTLSVCASDHAWFTNLGTTNLVLPNQMMAWLTTSGTNIVPALLPLSFCPTYNLVNCTNVPAAQLSGTIPGPVFPSGGATGQFLELTGTSPNTVAWGTPSGSSGGSGSAAPFSTTNINIADGTPFNIKIAHGLGYMPTNTLQLILVCTTNDAGSGCNAGTNNPAWQYHYDSTGGSPFMMQVDSTYVYLMYSGTSAGGCTGPAWGGGGGFAAPTTFSDFALKAIVQ